MPHPWGGGGLCLYVKGRHPWRSLSLTGEAYILAAEFVFAVGKETSVRRSRLEGVTSNLYAAKVFAQNHLKGIGGKSSGLHNGLLKAVMPHPWGGGG